VKIDLYSKTKIAQKRKSVKHLPHHLLLGHVERTTPNIGAMMGDCRDECCQQKYKLNDQT
jgi:hypothetical protein